MKPSDDPVPSGDRTFARLIRTALQRAGHAVSEPSRLVTWRPTPDGLDALISSASEEVSRIEARWRQEGIPDAIVTYHTYHKAPDLLGPRLAALFGLPYAIVEASRAPRRASGAWARHFALADEALARADAVAAVTAHDHEALAAHMPDRVVLVPPFVDIAPFAPPGARDGHDAHGCDGTGRHGIGAALVSAAMMRPGRKSESVRILADVITRVRAHSPNATLTIAGDGPERASLEPEFPSGTFVGRLGQGALAQLFHRSDIFVWPAVDEPFGFVFLEAQAAGLPVVGGAARGVRDVVRAGETGLLVPPRDAGALAEAVMALVSAPERRVAMGRAARDFAAARDLSAGARALDALLSRAAAHRAAQGSCR